MTTDPRGARLLELAGASKTAARSAALAASVTPWGAEYLASKIGRTEIGSKDGMLAVLLQDGPDTWQGLAAFQQTMEAKYLDSARERFVAAVQHVIDRIETRAEGWELLDSQIDMVTRVLQSKRAAVAALSVYAVESAPSMMALFELAVRYSQQFEGLGKQSGPQNTGRTAGETRDKHGENPLDAADEITADDERHGAEVERLSFEPMAAEVVAA